jgi:hypothetical protein
VLLIGKLAFSQHYHHNVFSFRLAFADTINSKINVELSLQKRTQGTSSNQDNLFKTNQVKSTWLWVNFNLSERSTISLSPFGYYQNFVLNAKPNDEYLPPVKEYRWSVRYVNEQKGRIVNYTNRYTAEYRLRDIHHNNIYTSSYRMRYMAKLEKPLYHLFSHTRSVKLELYDELFLQMGHAVYNKPNIFDQNRVYLGFNYELFRNFKTSIGYVYGIQERSSGEEFDNMNMLWVVLTFENVFTQFRHKKI